LRSGPFGGHKSGSSYGQSRSLFGLPVVNDVSVDTDYGKDHDLQNLWKMIIWYRSIYV